LKRLLLFLLFFGAGLAALLYLRKDERAERARLEQAREEAPVPERFTELPMGGQKGAALHLDGALEIIKRAGEGDTLRTEYALKAVDVDFLEGDAYEAKSLDLALHDPVSGRLRMRLKSPSTRMRLSVTGDKPLLAEDEKVHFSNAELTILEGGAIAPLTLRMPQLAWRPKTNDIDTPDRVQIIGRGLESRSNGLEASWTEQKLKLLREGRVELELEQGAKAILSATGEGVLLLERATPPAQAPQGSDAVQLTVSGGSRLELERPNATRLELDGRDLHFVGYRTPEGRFVIVDANARGNVRGRSGEQAFQADEALLGVDTQGFLVKAELGGNVVLEDPAGRFESQAASFAFGEATRLTKAVLTGSPSGVVELGSYAPKDRPEMASARARIRGNGPLELDFTGSNRMVLEGPARVEIEEIGFTLSADERLIGNIDRISKTGRIEAIGGASANWKGSEIYTGSLDLRYALADARGEVAGAIASGATQAVLRLPGTEEIRVDASDGLEVRSIGGYLTLPLARGVTVRREQGVERFRADAQLVRDLDPKGQTFEAEGDVRFENRIGRGKANRAVARGPRDHALHGTANNPAHWEALDPNTGAIQATAQAVEIQAREHSVEANGSVLATVAAVDAYHRIDSEYLLVERLPDGAVPLAESRNFHLRAERSIRARSESSAQTMALSCQLLDLQGRLTQTPEAQQWAKGSKQTEAPAFERGQVHAEGNVAAEWMGPQGELSLSGEVFDLDTSKTGSIRAREGGRVRAVGSRIGGKLPYQLDADWILFDEKSLEAQNANIALLESKGSDDEAMLVELASEKLRIDGQKVQMHGSAHALGRTRTGTRWVIDAGTIDLAGNFERREGAPQGLEAAEAHGDVRVQLGEDLLLTGEHLVGTNNRLRLDGLPARISDPGTIWESPWIEYDPEKLMLATGRGQIRARDQRNAAAWSVEYDSLQPFEDQDTTILVLRNPRMKHGLREVTANWSLFWIDREEWRQSGGGAIKREVSGAELHVDLPEAPPAERTSDDWRKNFEQLRRDPLARIVSEFYLEGEVELVEREARDPRKSLRRARAAAFYLDLRQEAGWLQEADVIIDLPFRGRGLPQKVRAKADWMRVRSDGSVSADRAVITSCEFDEPHYMIETGRLRIQPSSGGKGWSFEARNNALRFGREGAAVPLPTINTPTDEKGNPFFLTNFFAGNSSQFGASVRATVNLALGTIGFGVGRVFAGALNIPVTELDGRWKFDVGYLGSRGLLLGGGLEFTIRDTLRLDLDYSVIPDGNEDRGLVRVPEDDRDFLRQWFRMRGRRFYGPTEWVDLAFSYQTDPGVQSEFFQKDYLRYEQKDNYVHYRNAIHDTYWAASAKVLLEDRTDIAELPSGMWFQGRMPIGWLGRNEVLYTGYAQAGYYQRRDGNPAYYPPFPDGLGDRDVVRTDTEHRLEMPMSLGKSALQLTPFISGRGTAWSEDAAEDGASARVVAKAGAELSTALWRTYEGGTISTLTPRLGVHGDLAELTSGGDPFYLDSVEDSQTGFFVDAGLRARWWHPRTKQRLDLDLLLVHGSGQETRPDGLLPLAMLGDFLTFVAEVPVGMTHDMRFDLESGDTVYSRTYLGFRPVETLGVEFGYHQGRDAAMQPLYEAASAALRFKATRKWELEASQTLSLSDDRGLDNKFTVRRLGHDFVVEIDFGFQAGEGSSFGVSFLPNLAYRASSLGLIDRWLGRSE